MKIKTTYDIASHIGEVYVDEDWCQDKWVAVDELAPQLDKVYDVLSNNTLSFEERISMAQLRLLEIEKELKGEDK